MSSVDSIPMYNDYPIRDCAKQAQPHIDKGNNIHQKWTCKHCGSRQGMETPNIFYASGKCEACKQLTIITHCNYLVILKLKA